MINFFAPSASWEEMQSALHDFLYTAPTPILAYWSYVPLTYCVKSYASSKELSERMRNFFPSTSAYIIAEINNQNIDGLLPKEAWNWFYAPPPTQLPAPTLWYQQALPSPDRKR
jgi:hypothetical protein